MTLLKNIWNIYMEKKQTWQHDVLMRSIKIVDIGYITVIYMTFSLFFAYLTDKFFGKFDEKKEKAKPNWQLTLEFVLAAWMYGVLIYVVRNLAQLIPFPLHGLYGFDHYRVKELGSAMIFTFTYLLFSDHIKSKMMFYYKHTVSSKSA